MTAYTDFHYSPTGSGVISGAQVLEQTEQGINGLGQYVQDNISGAIDTANQALTIAQTADSNATLALNTANSFASAISAANNTANNALTTAQSAQNTANSASSLATTANNNANTALNAANTATSNVANLTSSVNALGNRMTAAENAINANAGNITTLQNNLATTNANVTAASNAASAAQATATSAQSTATLARNQAYVLRYTGTTITGGGTIAYTDIDNTDNIKAGDKIIDISGAIYAIASVDTANQTVTVGASPVINLFCDAENLIPAANEAYDLGSSSYQWNNLYAKNYYYNGTAWGLDKANVWSAENTFTSEKTYQVNNNPQHILKCAGLEIGVQPANSYIGTTQWFDKNNNELGFTRFVEYNNSAQTYEIRLSNKATNGVLDPTGSVVATNIQLVLDPNGVSKLNLSVNAVRPVNNGSSDLGDSTHKWKSFNGVNPGALSLPDMGTTADVNYFDFTSTITPLDGTDIFYRPPVDGWMTIIIAGTALALFEDASSANPHTQGSGATTAPVKGYCEATIPVHKNVRVKINAIGTSVYMAQVRPCMGNV